MCGDITLELTKLQNMRVRVRFMIQAAKALQKEVTDEKIKSVFEAPLAEATALLDLEHITRKRAITLNEYQVVVDTLKGCATIAYPSECTDRRGGRTPVENLCKQLDDESCENPDHIRCLLALIDDGARTDDMLPEGQTQLWWASKQLHSDDLLKKYTGKNEKTKLICKLTKLGSSVPTKEPVIDIQAQQDMMAYWHRKQEENKKLQVDDDISYGNSQWADPKGLKNHFQGTSNISWRPK
eukprot:TRINITY_DN42046_c0_g1_i1.p1 TRINITY_DN42046_c0_g1~~TRINITY_DN42046_c0_g1_i1.p1  ORF type:complete len:278 (+),score=78.64 TRINITY_DN42046_c0_g1_i1:116-835(+)